MRRIAPGDWPADQQPVYRILNTAQRKAVLARYEELQTEGDSSVPRFLSVTEVAEYLGFAGPGSMSRYKLCAPDALIGKIEGWLPSTIDEWSATRSSPQVDGPSPVARFLSLTEVAHLLGFASVNSMSRYKLPAPDAMIGKIKGWLPSNINEWNVSRPRRRSREAPPTGYGDSGNLSVGSS